MRDRDHVDGQHRMDSAGTVSANSNGQYGFERSVRKSNSLEYGENGGSDTNMQTSSHVDNDSGFISELGPTGLAIGCACVAALLFICIGALLWIKNRRRRQRLLKELTFHGCEEGHITKSAPSSRCHSPKNGKRMSCPDALAAHSKSGSMLVKSWTCDPIIDSTLPPECVQPKMYTESAASYQSVSEENAWKKPTSSSRGKIWFSTFYDALTEQLNVNLIKVKDLPKRDTTNEEPDPFVKMYLLPDEKACQVSKSKKKTNSPIYNEIHQFKVPPVEVKDRVLRFSVYDVDKRRVRHSLGHIVINLNDLDLDKGEVMCTDLEGSVQSSASLGDIQLSLAYIPPKEKVKIGVHKARKLQIDKDLMDRGAYVKIQLYYGHKCHRIKRTVTRQIMENCPFEESLSFTIQGRQLESCSLVVSIMITQPHEFNKNDVEYGRVVIGPFMYARGEELAHWQEMVSKPKTVTTHWHSLVPPTQ